MCGRFVLMTPSKSLVERFGLEEEPVLEPRYNIAPTQMVAVIRDRDTLQRRLLLVKWRLVTFWAEDASIGQKMINATTETAAEKPPFRSAFKSRRCLVPADGIMMNGISRNGPDASDGCGHVLTWTRRRGGCPWRLAGNVELRATRFIGYGCCLFALTHWCEIV